MMYQERRDALCDGLEGIGWERPNAHGSMFVWARLPHGRQDSMAFAAELMERAKTRMTQRQLPQIPGGHIQRDRQNDIDTDLYHYLAVVAGEHAPGDQQTAPQKKQGKQHCVDQIHPGNGDKNTLFLHGGLLTPFPALCGP